MLVFMTGGSGFVGSALIEELLSGGHQVLALARSDAAIQRLSGLGAAVEQGGLDDHDVLRAAARRADAAVHLAFNNDFSKFEETCRIDEQAIRCIGDAIAGTRKPFIVPNGLAGIVPGSIVTEDDALPSAYAFPRRSEQVALELASQGVNAMVVRLAQVHGTSRQGLVSGLIHLAKNSGLSAYIGDGANRWPAVHVLDAAGLFARILERPRPGARFHAVGEEGIEMRAIAEVIGSLTGTTPKSFRPEAAEEHFGPLSMFVEQDMPASSQKTRDELQWEPSRPGLVSDLELARI